MPHINESITEGGLARRLIVPVNAPARQVYQSAVDVGTLFNAHGRFWRVTEVRERGDCADVFFVAV